MKDVEKTRIDRRSFVKRAIGAGAVGSALLGVTACEDVPLCRDTDVTTRHADLGLTRDTGFRADPRTGDPCR